MKLDLTKLITDLKGTVLKDGGEELTLAGAISAAMLVPLPTDQELKGPEKVRMFRIAQRAADGGEQEFAVEDVALIKDRIGKLYGPLVVGRVYDIIGA